MIILSGIITKEYLDSQSIGFSSNNGIYQRHYNKSYGVAKVGNTAMVNIDPINGYGFEICPRSTNVDGTKVRCVGVFSTIDTLCDVIILGDAIVLIEDNVAVNIGDALELSFTQLGKVKPYSNANGYKSPYHVGYAYHNVVSGTDKSVFAFINP